MREAGGALIVKAGCDAASIAVVDVYWTASGEQKRACKVIAAKEFAEEASAAAFVRRWQAFVQESMEVPLAPLRAPLSSKRVRFESAGQVGSLLYDLLKAALRSEGSQVQLVILHAAALMGRADYAAGQFTLANLYAELAGLRHNDNHAVRARRSGASRSWESGQDTARISRERA